MLKKGKVGETYLIGSNCEKSNLEIISSICKILKKEPKDYISYVKDRPGHDFRYAIDSSKIEEELRWKAKVDLKEGLKKTIKHYA